MLAGQCRIFGLTITDRYMKWRTHLFVLMRTLCGLGGQAVWHFPPLGAHSRRLGCCAPGGVKAPRGCLAAMVTFAFLPFVTNGPRPFGAGFRRRDQGSSELTTRESYLTRHGPHAYLPRYRSTRGVFGLFLCDIYKQCTFLSECNEFLAIGYESSSGPRS